MQQPRRVRKGLAKSPKSSPSTLPPDPAPPRLAEAGGFSVQPVFYPSDHA